MSTIRLRFWLRCSKQTDRSEIIEVPRGLSEDAKKDYYLDPWVERVHPHCSGSMRYGWRRVF